MPSVLIVDEPCVCARVNVASSSLLDPFLGRCVVLSGRGVSYSFVWNPSLRSVPKLVLMEICFVVDVHVFAALTPTRGKYHQKFIGRAKVLYGFPPIYLYVQGGEI